MGLFQVNRHDADGSAGDSARVGKPANATRARRRADEQRKTVTPGSSTWFTVDKSAK